MRRFSVLVLAMILLLQSSTRAEISASVKSATSSGPSTAITVTANVWSGAINSGNPVSQRTITFDTRGFAFNLDQCGITPNLFTLTAPSKTSPFTVRQAVLVPFDSVTCVNASRMLLVLHQDPYYVAPNAGEVITVTFSSDAFQGADVNGFPYVPSAHTFWFRVQASAVIIRTGVNDQVLHAAYGVSAVSTIFASLTTNHPMLVTVMPRAEFLFAISLCSFSTMFSVDVVQYPLQIAFDDTDANVWGQFYAVGTMNGVFVLFVFVLVYVGAFVRRYRHERDEILQALAEKRKQREERNKIRREAAERRNQALAVAATKYQGQAFYDMEEEIRWREMEDIRTAEERMKNERQQRRRRERARHGAPPVQKNEPECNNKISVEPGSPDEKRMAMLAARRATKMVNRRQRRRDDEPYSSESTYDSDDSRDSVTQLLLQDERVVNALLSVPEVAPGPSRRRNASSSSASSGSESSSSDEAAPAMTAQPSLISPSTTRMYLDKPVADALKDKRTQLRAARRRGAGRMSSARSHLTQDDGGDAAAKKPRGKRPPRSLHEVAMARVWRHGATQPGSRNPGSVVVCTLLLLFYKASVSSSAVVFWQVTDPGVRVGMVIVLLAWFVIPCAFVAYATFWVLPYAIDIAWVTEERRLQSTFDAFVAGQGHWRVIDPGPRKGHKNAQRVAAFLPLFEAYRPGRTWFVAVEVLCSTAFGVLEATRTDKGCQYIAAPAALLGAVYLASIVFLSPHAAPFDRVCYIIAAVVYTVAPMAQTVYFISYFSLANIFASFLITALLFGTFSRAVVAAVQLHDYVSFKYVHRLPWGLHSRFGKWTFGVVPYALGRPKDPFASPFTQGEEPAGGDGGDTAEQKTNPLLVLPPPRVMSIAEALGRPNVKDLQQPAEATVSTADKPTDKEEAAPPVVVVSHQLPATPLKAGEEDRPVQDKTPLTTQVEL